MNTKINSIFLSGIVSLSLSSNVMAESNDMSWFKDQLMELELSLEKEFPYGESLGKELEIRLCKSIKSKSAMIESERDRLVDELHYCFRQARDAILNCRAAINKMHEIDAKEASRAAVEGCLAGLAAGRSPISAITGIMVGCLANIAGQTHDNCYEVLRYARDADYWGKKFDDVYCKIQKG